jgi:hypothetical protein
MFIASVALPASKKLGTPPVFGDSGVLKLCASHYEGVAKSALGPKWANKLISSVNAAIEKTSDGGWVCANHVCSNTLRSGRRGS